jgi:hypothetical protein
MIHFLKDSLLAIFGEQFRQRRDLRTKLFHVEQFQLCRAESVS